MDNAVVSVPSRGDWFLIDMEVVANNIDTVSVPSRGDWFLILSSVTRSASGRNELFSARIQNFVKFHVSTTPKAP